MSCSIPWLLLWPQRSNSPADFSLLGEKMRSRRAFFFFQFDVHVAWIKKGPLWGCWKLERRRDSRLHIQTHAFRRLRAVVFVFSVIVANSSPLPNIDHVMCLIGGGVGVGGVVLAALLNDFSSELCAWVDIFSQECIRACFLCRCREKQLRIRERGVMSIWKRLQSTACHWRCRREHSSSL